MVSNTPSPYRKLRSITGTTACSGGTNFPLISAVILARRQGPSRPGRGVDGKSSRPVSVEKHTQITDANSTLQKTHPLSQVFLRIQRRTLSRPQCPRQRGNKQCPAGKPRRG